MKLFSGFFVRRSTLIALFSLLIVGGGFTLFSALAIRTRQTQESLTQTVDAIYRTNTAVSIALNPESTAAIKRIAVRTAIVQTISAKSTLTLTVPPTTRTVTATFDSRLRGCPPYQEASEPLLEPSVQIQSALKTAGITDVDVLVEVFGEACYDSEAKASWGFSGRQLGIRIEIKKEILDNESLGQLLKKILDGLDLFPLSGKSSHDKYPDLVFLAYRAKGQQKFLRFTVSDSASLRQKGLTGSALLKALCESDTVNTCIYN